MAEIRLPRWLLTNRCMPAGRRQGKKPVWISEEPVKKSWSEKLFGPRLSAANIFYPAEISGLFEGWEYRFWAADLENPAAIIAECRCCKSLFSNDNNEARKKHSGGCYKKLCAAYKLLLKDMVCVVCNHKTTKEKWGVPLCSSACMEAWCTCDSQPDSLKDALRLVGDVG